MAKHEKCENNEIFIGNINTIAKDKEIKRLTDKNIKFRIGNLAYDIHGNQLPIEQCLPLFIKKESLSIYDTMMMTELRAIRGF